MTAALWVKSNYSFLEGASHPDELVSEAHRLGLSAMALTDRDGVYGIVRAHMKARELGLHLIIGSEVTLFDDSTIILLAESRRGYANLCQLITQGRLRSPKGSSQVRWSEICARAEGLSALWGGGRGLIGREESSVACDRIIDDLRDAFADRLSIAIARHREAGEARRERRLRDRAREYGLPTVAVTEVLYHSPSRRDLQDVLTCVRHGVTLSTAKRRTCSNAEHALLAPFGFERLFVDDPGSIARTKEIAERCQFNLEEIRYRYPAETLPGGVTTEQWLHHLTWKGAEGRYPDGIPDDVRTQVDKELSIIGDLEYDGYFLTMWEIVRYCRESGILCQGRGSAANSAVCYCLGITAIDPVRMGLLFERFLSKERAEPPDIDVDIEHNRREEVIQHVYKKYGRSHAAMVANFIRYRARSAVREVGKVLGIAETTVDRLAKTLSHYHGPAAGSLDIAGLDPESKLHQNLLRLSAEIQDFPRHLSIHPGGFLLGHDPVNELVPIENATMEDRTVIQWDKEDVENLGLFKVDLLGLGALNVVHLSLDLIEEHQGQRFCMATIPHQDEPTYDMIRKGDTVGVFQIESRAQMAMLPRLAPRNYYDLVIEISIVRPGPISGGMVHPYLRRRSGVEEVTYPHPSLKPVLEKTLGIPLFQEQVMQLAIVAADYTPGEADQLRRDMAAWRQAGRIEGHRERLISRMMRKGIAREFAERVFEQIRGFGEYGFPESHAASFALIGYATAWLKCHHPATFLCALLNAQPMGFYSPATLVDDAKRHDVVVRPIDVQRSLWDCSLERVPRSGEGFAVRMGLRYVKGLQETFAQRVVEARPDSGYESIDDLASRARLAESALGRLSEAGALQSLQPERRQALWEAHGTGSGDQASLDLRVCEERAQFGDLTEFESIRWDYESTGHSTRGHPLEALRATLAAQKIPSSVEIHQMPSGRRVRYAGLVICRQRPGTAGGVVFMTLEDETGFVNLIIWERVFATFEIVAKTASFLGVTGKLQSESGVVHLVVEEMWEPDLSKKPETRSRDFH